MNAFKVYFFCTLFVYAKLYSASPQDWKTELRESLGQLTQRILKDDGDVYSEIEKGLEELTLTFKKLSNSGDLDKNSALYVSDRIYFLSYWNSKLQYYALIDEEGVKSEEIKVTISARYGLISNEYISYLKSKYKDKYPTVYFEPNGDITEAGTADDWANIFSFVISELTNYTVKKNK